MVPEVAEVLEAAKSLEHGEIADLAYQLLRVLDDGATADRDRADATTMRSAPGLARN